MALAEMTVLRSLLRSPAAIDRDRRARDLVCGSPTQEGNRAAKLFRRDEIRGRLFLSQEFLECLLLTDASLRSDVADLLFDQRRSHPTRTDRIASHAAPGGLQADHLCQADQPVDIFKMTPI
jgi:hypothetical protein